MSFRSASRFRPVAGFTLIELVTVIILMGVLGAIGASRFFDSSAFENRAYADQAKTIIRYAQKLAIARNTYVFVRTNGNSFAVCSTAACNAADIIPAPGGSNSGSRVTRANCLQNGAYVANWMCEGRPAGVAVAGFGNSASIYFDALGRPYNGATPIGTASNFVTTDVTFTSGTNVVHLRIWQETGYVQ
jgi:MSHA pilin protein MshC